MPGFSDVVMPHLEAERIQTDEEVKYWIQKSARVFGGKRVAGLDRDQRYPQKRSNPSLKYLLLIGGQAQASPAGWKNMDPFKADLLNRIVRSFPGNHDVMHVALAQAGSADAYKARLLQQFRNAPTPAITHPRPQPAHHLMDNHCHGA